MTMFPQRSTVSRLDDWLLYAIEPFVNNVSRMTVA